MGLFRRDPWAADGVRTIATIERVMVTEIGVGGARGGGGGRQADDEVVYLAFRFTDEQGAEVVHERRSNLRPDKIPAPGWSVLVAYVAGKPETVDYDPRAMRPPDPSVPRGWGAGIFEVEDLGTHGAKSPVAERGLERQRELFRSGRRSQAEIVGVDAPIYRLGLRLKRGAAEVTLKLRVDGGDIETKAWVPAACVPEPGDLIQIATGADRSEVALDSDERYDAPPGQALVFTTPSELAAKRPPLPPIDVEANRPWTPERISEFNATGHTNLVAATAQQAAGNADAAQRVSEDNSGSSPRPVDPAARVRKVAIAPPTRGSLAGGVLGGNRVVQPFGSEIGAIRPRDGVAVDECLSEVRGVLQRLEQWGPRGRSLYLARPARVYGERFDAAWTRGVGDG